MYLVITVIILAAILLILAVLMQNSKGGGLDAQFSSGANQLLGAKRSADLLEKITWSLLGGMFVLILITTAIQPKNSEAGGVKSSVNFENIETKPAPKTEKTQPKPEEKPKQEVKQETKTEPKDTKK